MVLPQTEAESTSRVAVVGGGTDAEPACADFATSPKGAADTKFEEFSKAAEAEKGYASDNSVDSENPELDRNRRKRVVEKGEQENDDNTASAADKAWEKKLAEKERKL